MDGIPVRSGFAGAQCSVCVYEICRSFTNYKVVSRTPECL